MFANTLVQGVAITTITLAAFLIGLRTYPDSLAAAQTVAFTTLVISELLRAYTSRSERYPLLRLGLLTNQAMLWATLSSFVLILAVIYLPAFEPLFSTAALSANDWLAILPLSVVPAISAECTKWVTSRRGREATTKPLAS
jgi:Ca2+-transporting ATPase